MSRFLVATLGDSEQARCAGKQLANCSTFYAQFFYISPFNFSLDAWLVENFWFQSIYCIFIELWIGCQFMTEYVFSYFMSVFEVRYCLESILIIFRLVTFLICYAFFFSCTFFSVLWRMCSIHCLTNKRVSHSARAVHLGIIFSFILCQMLFQPAPSCPAFGWLSFNNNTACLICLNITSHQDLY